MVPAEQPPPQSWPRVPELDGIRSVAICLVLLAHAGLQRLIPGGFGVTVFFFLSGFLITSMLRVEVNNTGTVNLLQFYVRRTLRIWPPLYITILICLAFIAFGLLKGQFQALPIFFQSVFLGNYLVDDGGLPLPLWSLAVEEHFYILFPLAYLFLARRLAPRQIAAVCAAVCLLVLVWRAANVVLIPDFRQNYMWTHTRIDSILFGCCLALWNNPILDRQAFRPRRHHVVAAFAVLALCLAVRDDRFRESIRYTLQGLALFVLFSAALQSKGRLKAFLGSRPMRTIGVLSYSVYLIHIPLFDALAAHFEAMPHALQSLLGIAMAFCYAALLYAVVEKPAAALRKRLHGPMPCNQGTPVWRSSAT